MLRIELTSPSGEIGALEIALEEGVVFGDYAAVVYDRSGRPISMAMVMQYARWSAPMHDLALRALANALCDSETDPQWHCIRHGRPGANLLEVTISLVSPLGSSRRLAYWRLPFSGAGTATERLGDGPATHVDLPVISRGESVWASLARFWCHRLTGTTAMPPRRRPVHVPRYWHGQVSYIRFSDIPEHIQPEFQRRTMLSTRPLVPEAPDAFYSWDLSTLLAYDPWIAHSEHSTSGTGECG